MNDRLVRLTVSGQTQGKRIPGYVFEEFLSKILAAHAGNPEPVVAVGPTVDEQIAAEKTAIEQQLEDGEIDATEAMQKLEALVEKKAELLAAASNPAPAATPTTTTVVVDQVAAIRAWADKTLTDADIPNADPGSDKIYFPRTSLKVIDPGFGTIEVTGTAVWG